MGKTFILLFTLFYLNVFSQEITSDKIFISDSLTGEGGKYYMEGKEIDMSKTFLDPKNIEKIESYFGKTARTRSGTKGAYLITRIKKTELVTLQKFVEKIKARNESLKNIENVNVVVDDLLIEKFSEYRIEESCVVEIKIFNTAPKSKNRDGNISTIKIITNRKNKGY
jgi:hypothetical protein